MDAEFVEFLDKKFQRVELRFDRVENQITDLREEVRELRKAVTTLTNEVDRFVHMHEEIRVEQAAIIADLNRIKEVLKEKLGVEI